MRAPTLTYRVRQTPATNSPVADVPGHPCRVGHPAFACFVHDSEDGWQVRETQTGLPVGRGGTRAAAKAAARAYFARCAEEFDQIRGKCLTYCPPLNPPCEKAEVFCK